MSKLVKKAIPVVAAAGILLNGHAASPRQFCKRQAEEPSTPSSSG